MANQITIDIGAAANDGTGDPLRTAFNYVNENFSNVWSTGLPTSNIQFSDNRILTVNTNANLVLAPNGIGKVASNVDIVPNTANVFGLGSLTRRWNTVYGQYLDLSHNATIGGNLVVTGNLTAGNISYTSNVFVGDLEGSVFDGASSIVLDVIDSTIYVDNYRYANGTPISFGGTPGGSNTQVQFNNNGSFAGNVNFAFFSDTGGLQTAGNVFPHANAQHDLGKVNLYWNNLYVSNVDVSNNVSVSGSIDVLGDITSNNSFTSNTITSADAYITRGTFSGDDETGDGSLYVGHPTFTDLGSDVMAQFTGNVGSYGQLNFQNYSNAVTASGDYIITNDIGTDTGGFVDLGMTSSTWNGTQVNSLGNLIGPSQGYLYVQDGNLSLGTKVGNAAGKVWTFDTAGNLTVAGNILPTANNTQSLGSPTHQWNDLYLSNATIYMNSVPISLAAGNVLTVNGADVVTTDANGQANIGNLQVNGTTIALVSGASQTQIEISPNIEGWAYLQIPNDATANVANVRMHNDAGNIEIAAGDTSRGGDVYYWYFNNNGTLTVPGDITSSETFAISSGDDINISGGDKVPGSASSEGGDITIFGGTGRPDSGTSVGSGGDVRINAGDGGDGTLSGAGAGGYAEVQGGSGGAANVVNNIQAGEGGYVVIQGGSGGDNAGNNALSGIGGNVEIYGGAGSFDDANSVPSGAPGHVNLYGGNWGWVTPSGNIYLNTYDGSNFKTLTYDNHGNVTMAPGGGLNFVGSNPGITSGLNQDFYVRVSDDEDEGWTLHNVVDDGAGAVLTQTRLDSDGFYVQTDVAGSNYQWNFNGYQGITNFPGNLQGTYGGDTSFYAYDNGSGGMVEMKMISYIGDSLLANVTIRHPNVTISTQGAAYTWTFDGTGNLILPPSGNIVGDTANNSGHLSWFGNSSGDGNGYTTMRLVPDDTLEGNDQYLIIDPTAPGHIHIRAGGTQDNSGSDLFLGGENSYFKVNAGANNEVRISANSHAWVFGADSILTVPGEGVIRSIQDTVILQSYDINGNTYSARLGTTGGLYFETTEYPLGWLSITNNAGNANITAASGTAGGAGKNIYITAGFADQSNYYTTPGGDVNITGGLGATNDGGGGGPGGNVNINAGESADPAGAPGNVNITAGSVNNWTFDNNGDLRLPYGGYIGSNNDFASLYSNIQSELDGISIQGNSVTTITNQSNVSIVADEGGDSQTWTFDNTGTLTAPGSITASSTVSGLTLVSTQSAANEGGEIQLALPSSGTTLTGNIIIDSYQNSIRFFESGNSRGLYVDTPNVSVSGQYAIGYRDVPQIALSGNVTANSITAGKHFYSTTAGNLQVTIPDNANVAFPLGATLTIVMNAAGNVIVAQGTGVSLYMAGSSTTGNRTVGAYGLASVMKVATDTWVISGTGVY